MFELLDGFLQCRKITMLDWTTENVLHHSANLNQAFGTCFAFFFTFPILQTAFFGSNCIDFCFCSSFVLLDLFKAISVFFFHVLIPFLVLSLHILFCGEFSELSRIIRNRPDRALFLTA